MRHSRPARDVPARPRPGLRSLPVSTILASQNTAGYTPNINTEVLPETLKTAFATGHFNRVPIINGTNRDEWRLFVALSELAGNTVTASNYQGMISSTLGSPRWRRESSQPSTR